MILNGRDNFINLSKLVLLKVWNLWVDLKDICTESWADEFPVLPLCGENPCFVFMQDLRPIGFHSSPLGQGAFISTLFPEAWIFAWVPAWQALLLSFYPLASQSLCFIWEKVVGKWAVISGRRSLPAIPEPPKGTLSFLLLFPQSFLWSPGG